MNERESISQLKEGDPQGLEILVKTYQHKAVRTAYLIVRNPALAEDVVEDAFIHAYQHIHQFDSQRPFGPWFYQIVVNIARRAAAKNERTIPFHNLTARNEQPLETSLADTSPGLEEKVEQAELHREIWAAIGRLTPAQRSVIIQRYYLGYSVREIAHDSGIPAGTIKWRLHAARKRLQKWLQPIQETEPAVQKVIGVKNERKNI